MLELTVGASLRLGQLVKSTEYGSAFEGSFPIIMLKVLPGIPTLHGSKPGANLSA